MSGEDLIVPLSQSAVSPLAPLEGRGLAVSEADAASARGELTPTSTGNKRKVDIQKEL